MLNFSWYVSWITLRLRFGTWYFKWVAILSWFKNLKLKILKFLRNLFNPIIIRTLCEIDTWFLRYRALRLIWCITEWFFSEWWFRLWSRVWGETSIWFLFLFMCWFVECICWKNIDFHFHCVLHIFLLYCRILLAWIVSQVYLRNNNLRNWDSTIFYLLFFN